MIQPKQSAPSIDYEKLDHELGINFKDLILDVADHNGLKPEKGANQGSCAHVCLKG